MFIVYLLLLLITILILAIIIFKLYCKLTAGICRCSNHLVGKVVIVTGGNNGIGYETSKDLAERGARVILACRNEGRGTAARDKIIADTGNADVHYRNLDLSSLASVRAFADGIIKNEKRLDILINNAGVYEVDNLKTEDGLSTAMQTNHFGPFLLTCLLLPLLKTSAPSRIINVSSLAYRRGKIEFDNLNLESETKETYSTRGVYSRTKLCNVLMTMELTRRLEGTGVTANSLHPGVVATDIILKLQSSLFRYLIPVAKYFFKTTWEGAQTTIFLAVSPEVEGVSGKYYADCREGRLTSFAQDKDVARKLWEVSESLVGLK